MEVEATPQEATSLAEIPTLAAVSTTPHPRVAACSTVGLTSHPHLEVGQALSSTTTTTRGQSSTTTTIRAQATCLAITLPLAEVAWATPSAGVAASTVETQIPPEANDQPTSPRAPR